MSLTAGHINDGFMTRWPGSARRELCTFLIFSLRIPVDLHLLINSIFSFLSPLLFYIPGVGRSLDNAVFSNRVPSDCDSLGGVPWLARAQVWGSCAPSLCSKILLTYETGGCLWLGNPERLCKVWIRLRMRVEVSARKTSRVDGAAAEALPPGSSAHLVPGLVEPEINASL